MADLIGILQTHPAYVDEGPSHETYFWNLEEKYGVVDAFGNNTHPTVYVVDKHAGGEKAYGKTSTNGVFEIPPEERLGRMIEGMVDENGNLHAHFQLFYEHPRSREIMKEIESGKKYGLSAGVDTAVIPGQGRVVEKRLQHIGLTMEPDLGDPNDEGNTTWIHKGAISYDSIDRIIEENYLSRKGMYASQRTRDRIAARKKPVTMTLGASRSPTNPPPFIAADDKTAAITPAANNTSRPTASMSHVTTAMSTGGVRIPTEPTHDDPIVTDAQSNNTNNTTPLSSSHPSSLPLSSTERDRKNELELQHLLNENKDFIASLVGSEDSSKFMKAVVVHDQLEKLMADPSIFNDKAKRLEIARVLGKMAPYIDNINGRMSEYVQAQKLDKKDQSVLSEMIKQNGTDTGFGPVLQSILASSDAVRNWTTTEAALRKEVEELKKRQREPEADARPTGSVSRQSMEQDNGRHQSQPESAAVRSTLGATRFTGSTIPRADHNQGDQFYGDLALSSDAFRNSPFARTTFDPELARHLAHISAVALRFQTTGSATAQGAVDRF